MLGWLGWTGIFIGMYLIGKKNIAGFYVAILAGFIINVDANQHGMWSLMVANTLMQCMYVMNIFKWRKSDGTKVQP